MTSTSADIWPAAEFDDKILVEKAAYTKWVCMIDAGTMPGRY